jgi:hypothetical protein
VSIQAQAAAWRTTIWAITSIFESGRPEGNPAAFQNVDAGIISYGKHQAALASGALARVLQAYFARSDSPVSRALQAAYAGRVAARDPALRHDARLRDLLIQAAAEAAMQAAQDAVFEAAYYQPAVQAAVRHNLATPLGLACLYDTRIQGGLDHLLQKTSDALGGRVGEVTAAGLIDERRWLHAFLDEREAWLLALADRKAAQGDQASANALRISTFRVAELRLLLIADNLALSGEFTVRGQRVPPLSPEEPSETVGGELMQAFNKIGFFGGGQRPAPNLDAWLTTLDNAGIPFCFVAPDVTSGLPAAQAIAQASATPHTVVYRSERALLRPDGRLPALDAAQAFWAAHKQTFPAELDPQTTWIQPLRQGAVTPDTANWLGEITLHLSEMALAEGFRLATFGFTTGQPASTVWETPSMLRALQLCAQHPDRLAVALEEFSMRRADIWFMRGEKIGRFQKLFDVCDRHQIDRPTVLITAVGWTRYLMPAQPADALTALQAVAELYAQFPQVRGAALWSLGAVGILARQTQRLIEPLTRFTLQTRFAPPVPPTPEPPPMSPEPPPAAAPQSQLNARYVSDVTIPDDTAVTFGAAFTKTWRVENNGSRPWGPDVRLVHTAGVPMTPTLSHAVPAAAPGEQVEISIPMTAPGSPGTHFSDWRFQDGQGNFFGDIIYARIAARPPVPVGAADGVFVADVTIPDDTRMQPGQKFTKTWRVKNSGARPWGAGFKLVFAGGTPMTSLTAVPLPATNVGQTTLISLELTAPFTPGTYYGDWRMQDDQGNFFGHIIYTRIQVPYPVGESLASPLSQRDPRWKDLRLGHAGSPKTIGEWGCLATCFAMLANALGESTTPAQLNDAMVRKGGFLELYLTKWNALSDVYSSIVYGGKFGPRADMTALIDASLAEGRPVAVMVDFTNDTPYTENDQHWVLIVAKDGADYRINDPWLWPPQEASLRERYGRAQRPLQDAILSAIFYRTTAQPTQPVQPEQPATAVARLQTGMNVNPDAPHSNPHEDDALKGLDWVRFVFKIDARVNPAERGDIQAAFSQYDPIVRSYNRMGARSLIIINQETIWGSGPWTGNGDWQGYAAQLAAAAGEIAVHYRRYGANVAYQIWNEGDKPNNPASVYVEPRHFAHIVRAVSAAIRAAAPDAPIIFNGMATGPEETVHYLREVQSALGGPLPVDAVGIHPYTRWATHAPFDWGRQYGTLGDAFKVYKAAFPNMKFWITEIGVADDGEIGPQFYAEIAAYLVDVYRHVGERYADMVPVLIWFAWSDWMRNAGIVDKNGNRKDHLYAAYRKVRNRELWA